MDKSLKELADHYGMSKQALQYHIKKLPKGYKNFATKNGVKILMVNEEGQRLLDSMVSKRVTNESTNLPPKNLIADLEQKIKLLELENELQRKAAEEKLEILKTESDKKDEQIKTLTNLLDQEQKLNAMNQQKIELLEMKNLEKEEVSEVPKKKWWKFW